MGCHFLLRCMKVESESEVVSDSSRPHGLQPTRLLHPWHFPGNSTGVGCHCLLRCMKVKSESEVAQSCPTLSDPMDCSPPGSSIRGIFQARALEWGASVKIESKNYRVRHTITTKMSKEVKTGLGVGQYELTSKRKTRLGRAGSMC